MGIIRGPSRFSRRQQTITFVGQDCDPVTLLGAGACGSRDPIDRRLLADGQFAIPLGVDEHGGILA